jgi:hypothetical protein
MEGYLGETLLDIKDTKFKDYTRSDWAMYFLESYGLIDGSHHKNWVLDQMARAIKGVKPIIKLAKWSEGTEEYRISLGEPTKEYLDWVIEMKDGEDGAGYDEGSPP